MSNTSIYHKNELDDESESNNGSESNSELDSDNESEYCEENFDRDEKPKLLTDSNGNILSKTSTEKITVDVSVTKYYQPINYWEYKGFGNDINTGNIVTYYSGDNPEIIIGYTKRDFITLPTENKHYGGKYKIYAEDYPHDSLEYLSGYVDIDPILSTISESIKKQYTNLQIPMN
ncbi:hypothetical protein [Megavirus chiliensis]|uniref:Uncharacterized protein n=2 Tax=Megamimivirinae TaxID=3044648 RepID=A0A2L2DLG9_MIMIV|nr:hypothetical protein MegaChil _gp0181 [Megavirus chiliensis]AEQ32958.1 hypothetical protein [Megavirus chiliensis]AVG47018.1 hypothetical protein [Acanthamoeba polyphaga mimivirus]